MSTTITAYFRPFLLTDTTKNNSSNKLNIVQIQLLFYFGKYLCVDKQGVIQVQKHPIV